MTEETKTKNEAILDLLEAEGPLSTHQIVERLNATGTLINGTGQALGRLRTLERRQKVQRIENPEHDGWNLWQLA